jgi:DNA-binding NarL/FixJ family response regulator
MTPLDLTPRQCEIIALVATGKTDATIADQLFCSPRTVNAHMRDILRKLNATNRTEAAVTWTKHTETGEGEEGVERAGDHGSHP